MTRSPPRPIPLAKAGPWLRSRGDPPRLRRRQGFRRPRACADASPDEGCRKLSNAELAANLADFLALRGSGRRGPAARPRSASSRFLGGKKKGAGAGNRLEIVQGPNAPFLVDFDHGRRIAEQGPVGPRPPFHPNRRGPRRDTCGVCARVHRARAHRESHGPGDPGSRGRRTACRGLLRGRHRDAQGRSRAAVDDLPGAMLELMGQDARRAEGCTAAAAPSEEELAFVAWLQARGVRLPGAPASTNIRA